MSLLFTPNMEEPYDKCPVYPRRNAGSHFQKMDRPSKRQCTGLARMTPNYTPIEQYLFLEVGALNERLAKIEEEKAEILEKVSVLENIVWKMLRNQGSYVAEVTEAVLEQEEPEDETGTITEMLAQWNAENEAAQQEWLELVESWLS